SRDACRQRRVIDGAAEHRRIGRKHELAAVGIARGDDAEFEHVANRIPATAFTLRRRQLYAPRHEQDARLHALVTRSTSLRTPTAYCSGLCSHSSALSLAASASRSCSARSESTRTSAAASASGSSGGTSTPLTPSVTRSGMPPVRVATTGRPRQNASITIRGSPSERD